MRTSTIIFSAAVALFSVTRAVAFKQQQVPLRALAPEIRIVSSDSIPQTQLSRVNDLLAAPDGFIFTADMREGTIRLYDPNGRFVRSFGRLGDGPGEFSTATNIVGAAGDTVLIYDQNRGYIHVFRRSGTFVRTQHLARVPRDRVLRGYLSDGRALVQITYFPTQRGRWMDSSAFRVTDSAAREIVRISTQHAPPRDLVVRTPGVAHASPQPFVHVTHAAQEPIGNRALAVLPPTYWGGRPGQVKLIFLNRDGVERERIVDLGARRMTDAIREAWIKRLIDPLVDRLAAGGTPRAAAESQLRDALVSGEYLPDVSDAMLGSDGAAWLKPYDSNDWVVVSPAGTIAFRVRVPENVRVYQVTMDRLWGVVLDADGLPIVIRYRVSAGQ
jgi:hypothetical protein